VVATRDGSTSEALFRTYQSAEESYNLTIWEACRATSAAPLFFEAIEVGKSPPVKFVDGGLGKNNPVNLVIREARSLWPTRPFAVVVSLGTGMPQMKPVGTKATEVLATCIRLATDAENTAREFRERQPHMVQMHKYFRFNVEQGLQNVGMEEWKTLGSVVEPATKDYLDKIQGEIEICAGVLKDPTSQ
jgi:predicted acylesterase/phospholipase RssA